MYYSEIKADVRNDYTGEVMMIMTIAQETFRIDGHIFQVSRETKRLTFSHTTARRGTK